MREAKEFLALAQEYFNTGNFIAANNYALKAIETYQEALACLTKKI
jgi:mannose-1-phosphate guanylyltransferase